MSEGTGWITQWSSRTISPPMLTFSMASAPTLRPGPSPGPPVTMVKAQAGDLNSDFFLRFIVPVE